MTSPVPDAAQLAERLQRLDAAARSAGDAADRLNSALCDAQRALLQVRQVGAELHALRELLEARR